MAKVWITEYTQTTRDDRGHEVPCAMLPSRATTVIDITSGAALMAQVLRDETSLIAVSGDAAFHMRITALASPTAASVADKRIPANTIVYYGVPQNNPSGYVVAAIAAA